MRVSRIVFVAGVAMLLSACDRVEGMRIGVNYTAKNLCSCLFVMERDRDSCYGDMIGAVERIPVEVDTDAGTVRASIFGVITGEASHERGRGCSLR
ncbi:MAG: hypothetical protein JRG90_17865 [Deltaproteobacteria bacterium]|nr:hypothetical protein [Deltaproteobacteria bacterium]MBW2666805.1 hypothetical protein [Deltaproteobacteria bacterium]